ncbi:MAG: hypothetical protein LBS15_01820 [Endomicrobium sp.]|jgi:hypothetical protein|nr:hypothetical protein [Endomicrobium sp.]
MKVVKVSTKKQFKEFVRLPWKIYSKNSLWVPPLISSLEDVFSKARSPFWSHAKNRLFLAYDDSGNVIGRIVGIVDYNYIKFQNDECGFFGFFECFNNPKAAEALFFNVRDWLREQNVHKMMGPMNPSTNDECGFLLEGFDVPPSFMMPYTPQYYLQLAEKCGLRKIKELYAYDMDVAEDSRVYRLERAVTIVKRKLPTLKVKTMQRKGSLGKYLYDVVSIYNRAWEKNWGFVPWSNEEFIELASKLKVLMDPEMVIMATVASSPVGVLISLPDYNQVLKKLNGKLFPFGILKFLYYRKKINSLRLMVMGVLKEYRHKGIEAVMYEKGLKNAIRNGYKHCELSWVLDDNVMTQRAIEMMNGKICKKYAVYGD